MKPFITPEIASGGKKLFRFQLENVDESGLKVLLLESSVVAYAMPIGHSFKAAWIFQIEMSNSVLLEFSSACTEVGSWQEVGTLNIRLGSSLVQTIPQLELRRIVVPQWRISEVLRLVYEDEEIRAECGLVIRCLGVHEVTVAAGIPPGSVSVKTDFAPDDFSPQFSLAECKVEPL